MSRGDVGQPYSGITLHTCRRDTTAAVGPLLQKEQVMISPASAAVAVLVRHNSGSDAEEEGNPVMPPQPKFTFMSALAFKFDNHL